jgi:hypothetical protein
MKRINIGSRYHEKAQKKIKKIGTPIKTNEIVKIIKHLYKL